MSNVFWITMYQPVTQPIINGHRCCQTGGGVIRLPQSGAGLGNLFRSFFRWIVPAGKAALKRGAAAGKEAAKKSLEVGKRAAGSQLVKSAAETLKKDAINAGIDIAQAAITGGDVSEEIKNQSKKMKNNLSGSVTASLEDLRPQYKKKKHQGALEISTAKKKKEAITDNLM